MDKFVNSNAYRVRGQAKDNESISESIENSFFSKRGLPTLNISNQISTPTSTPQPAPQKEKPKEKVRQRGEKTQEKKRRNMIDIDSDHYPMELT